MSTVKSASLPKLIDQVESFVENETEHMKIFGLKSVFNESPAQEDTSQLLENSEQSQEEVESIIQTRPGMIVQGQTMQLQVKASTSPVAYEKLKNILLKE